MALDSLTSQAVLGHAAGPTLLQQFQARQAEAEKAELDKQVTLSNLATQAVQRQGMQQQQSQEEYRFGLEQERANKYRSLFQDISATSDPAVKFEKAKGLFQIAAQTGDVVGMQMAKTFLDQMSPAAGYEYQQKASDLDLAKTESDILLQERQGQAALMRAANRRGVSGAKPSLSSMPRWQANNILSTTLDRESDSNKKEVAPAALTTAYNRVIDYAKNSGIDVDVNALTEELRRAVDSSFENGGWWKGQTLNMDTMRSRLNEVVNKYTSGQQITAQPPENINQKVLSTTEARTMWLLWNQKNPGKEVTLDNFLKGLQDGGYELTE